MKLEQLLGFSAQEKKLYRVLNDKPMTVAQVSDGSSLPRMTVHYALERFMKRGLVKRLKRDKTFKYFKVAPQEIFKNLDVFQSHPVNEKFETEIHTGYDIIAKVYKQLIAESENKRLRTIQTTASTKVIYETYPLEQLHNFDELINNLNVIVDDIVEETFFRPIFNRYPDKFEVVIESFLDRTLVTHVIPINILQFTNDVVISLRLVALIDWQTETLTLIKSQQQHKIFLSFYNLLSTYARKTSFKELAKPYLKN